MSKVAVPFDLAPDRIDDQVQSVAVPVGHGEDRITPFTFCRALIEPFSPAWMRIGAPFTSKEARSIPYGASPAREVADPGNFARRVSGDDIGFPSPSQSKAHGGRAPELHQIGLLPEIDRRLELRHPLAPLPVWRTQATRGHLVADNQIDVRRRRKSETTGTIIRRCSRIPLRVGQLPPGCKARALRACRHSRTRSNRRQIPPQIRSRSPSPSKSATQGIRARRCRSAHLRLRPCPG